MLSQQVFHPLSARSTFTELMPRGRLEGPLRLSSNVVMAVASSAGARSAPHDDLQHGAAADRVVGAAELTLTRSCGANVASAMLRRWEMNVAGRIEASPIFAGPGHGAQAFMTVAYS